jgi:hypothetical protein
MWTTFVDYFENQIAAFNQLIEEWQVEPSLVSPQFSALFGSLQFL